MAGWRPSNTGWLSRRDDGAITSLDGTQHGLRATSSVPLGPASLSASFEHGTVDSDSSASSRPYNVLSCRRRPNWGTPGRSQCYAAHDDGNNLTGGHQRRGERRSRPEPAPAVPSQSGTRHVGAARHARRVRRLRRLVQPIRRPPRLSFRGRTNAIASRPHLAEPALAGFARRAGGLPRVPHAAPTAYRPVARRRPCRGSHRRWGDGAAGGGRSRTSRRPGRGHRQERARVLQRPRSRGCSACRSMRRAPPPAPCSSATRSSTLASARRGPRPLRSRWPAAETSAC